MLFSVGFMVTFLLGGLSGVMLASPPIDFHVTDTYFLVAHFHYVLFGTIVFATYAGIYFWFPKMTGRLLDERLGKLHFWLTLIGFHTTFLVQHWLGNEGMPRRYADYLPDDGFTTLNIVSTIGAFTLGASMLPFVWNIFKSYRYGEVVVVDDRGATATPWNGSPPVHRPGTTSPNYPGSARSGPLSNCTTRTWPTGCAPKPTSAANDTPTWPRKAHSRPQTRTTSPADKHADNVHSSTPLSLAKDPTGDPTAPHRQDPRGDRPAAPSARPAIENHDRSMHHRRQVELPLSARDYRASH
jgi:cytochrome c oxidase subunit 1